MLSLLEILKSVHDSISHAFENCLSFVSVLLIRMSHSQNSIENFRASPLAVEDMRIKTVYKAYITRKGEMNYVSSCRSWQ